MNTPMLTGLHRLKALIRRAPKLTSNSKIASVILFFLLLYCLAVAPVCKRNGPISFAGTKNHILKIGIGAEPQDLDPHIVTGVPEGMVITALFEGLIARDPKDLGPIPGAAASWKISRDGLSYTFLIRKNARWSNGDPLLAEDFVYSWQRILSPSLAAEYAYMLYPIKNARKYNRGDIKDFAKVGVRASGKRKLVIRLDNPTPYFLNILQHYTSFPVHRKTLQKFEADFKRGTKWTRPGNIVSNGPFLLKKWKINSVIETSRNPNYWDARSVKLKGIHFFPIDQLLAEERNFRAGKLHITYGLFSDKIPRYRKKKSAYLRIDPYLGTYFYRFNVKHPPLDDVRVRRALAMTIDRNAIVKNVTRGGQLPATSLVPPQTAGYKSRHSIPFDPVKANKLLASAGYENGRGFPRLELLYNTNEDHKKISEAIQQMWKKNLGIHVLLVNQEWKVYLSSIKSGRYAIARSSWIGDYVDPNNFLEMFVTGGGNNRTGWSHSVYDKLIVSSRRSRQKNMRYALFQKAEDILMKEAPIAPVYHYTNVYLLSPDVKNWFPTIQNVHPYKAVFLEARQ